MQQTDLTKFSQVFAQNGALTINNLLPEDLAAGLHEEMSSLDWVLQVKDYGQNDRFEIPLSEIANRDNLIEVLYNKKHDIDLDNLFYIRLAVAKENLVSANMSQLSEFLNSEKFIDTCKVIVNMSDISHAWIEATCYDKGCFLGNHRDDHHPDNRVAFVLNLTRSWSIDWGGLLLLENNPGQQPLLVPPGWNTLSLFKIPVNHAVTAVSQAAKEHRYSITGWLRP